MRVLSLSLDGTIIEKNSLLEERMLSLSAATGEVTVLVPANREGKRTLSSHLSVHAVKGSKKEQFRKLFRIGGTLLKEKPYDLVTAQDPFFLGLVAFLLARKAKVPFEVQVHGIERQGGARKLILRFVLKRADRVRVVSDRLRRFVAALVGDAKVYVLPVYSQMSALTGREAQSPAPKNDGPFTFLTVGRLVPVKNISMQLCAFATLREELPRSRLIIVGDGPEADTLKSEARRLGIGRAVSFEGRQRDLAPYYTSADAFLLTSDSEGWGVAVIEAALHKLPVIMTDVGLAGDIIKNGESGIVVPTGNESALLHAMREVAKSGHLRVRLGEQAYRSARSLPSPEAHISRQVEEWKRLRACS